MDLDRGTLANIDRKVLSGRGSDETYRMVRVPASEAVWSVWKRYCDAVGVSMGRAILALVKNELQSFVGEADALPLFLQDVEKGLTERERALDAKERSMEELRRRLSENERRIHLASLSAPTTAAVKIGRNEPCPCGSGMKHKRCHGA